MIPNILSAFTLGTFSVFQEELSTAHSSPKRLRRAERADASREFSNLPEKVRRMNSKYSQKLAAAFS